MARSFILIACAAVLALTVTGCDSRPKSGVTIEGYGVTQDAPDPAHGLITPADIEQVSGLSGVKVLPFDSTSPALVGDVNLVDESGVAIANVYVGDAENWDEWLTDGYSVSEPLTEPVGDEAFIGPSPDVSATLTIFAFRKGDTAILIESTLDANGETRLSIEEMRALAGIVVSRL